MTEDFEPRVNLSFMQRDAQLRAERIASVIAQRIRAQRRAEVRENARLLLARFAVPAVLAAAASLAFMLLSARKTEGDAFAAFVMPRGPAAAWVTTGRTPDIAELATVAGDVR